jgi:hypothetical protein
MRVTLNQDELFEAISTHLSDKLNLDSNAKIEISLTAGRSPKGYTADVDITYPKSEMASKITARNNDEDEAATITATTAGDTQTTAAPTTPDAAAGGAVPVDNLFGG